MLLRNTIIIAILMVEWMGIYYTTVCISNPNPNPDPNPNSGLRLMLTKADEDEVIVHLRR